MAAIACLAFACERPPEPVEIAAADRESQPASWQVEGPFGGELFLLGSIHVGPKEGWTLPPEAMARFEAADALLVEVDMRGGNPEEQDAAVMRHAFLPPGESVKDHLSPDTYARLERYITRQGRNMVNVHPWKPWMLATMVLLEELQRLGYPTEAGVDLDLMQRAGESKAVIGLETTEEQLRLLGGLSRENQELMLKDTLLQLDDIEAHFLALKEAWRTGDVDALEALLFAELKRNPELTPFYEAVIFERNETMCERMARRIEPETKLFAVVGAAHLVGERGIPACLEARGNRVERTSHAGR